MGKREGFATYRGELPVPAETLKEWFADGIHTTRISFPITFDNIVWSQEDTALAEAVERNVGVPLIDIYYTVDKKTTVKGWKTNPGTNALHVFAEGRIYWPAYEDANWYDEEGKEGEEQQ